jgi:hypothetical protein
MFLRVLKDLVRKIILPLLPLKYFYGIVFSSGLDIKKPPESQAAF